MKSNFVINWRNCAFFFTTTALGVVGGPIYIWKHGLTAVDVTMFLVWTVFTGMSITVGYHRLCAHRSFKAHPIFQFFCLFFGAAAFQESLLQWTSQHRNHHRYVDTDQDPYNIKQGFFYAHIGWLIFRKHPINYDNVKDLENDRFIRSQHDFYPLWAIAAGIMLPLFIGACTGNMLGAFLIGIAARITFVHQSTFMINSVCHYFGKSTYDQASSPRDHWIVALITNGEGYHSFHHRFPSDYRNGVKWYHWDPSKWAIRLLAFVGLASDLKRASEFQILSAALVADKESVERSLGAMPQKVQVTALTNLMIRYERIKDLLHTWELKVKEYAAISKQGLKESDAARKKAAQLQAKEAREQFLRMREQWADFVEQMAFKFAFQP